MPRHAPTTVCSISELVEAILQQAHLSPFELLNARRISKTFDNVIIHALPFRCALFLEPDLSTTTDPAQVEINPFLENICPPGAQTHFDLVLGRAGKGHYFTEGRDVLVGRGEICQRCYSKRINLASLGDERCYLHLPLLETGDEEDYFHRAMWYERALWRKMYATRPVLPVYVVDATPLAHKFELPAVMTLDEIINASVVGEVVLKE